MGMNSFSFVALVVAALLTPAAASEPRIIDVASTFPSSMPVLGDVYQDLPKQVSQSSGQTLELRFHEPNKLVPAAETVKAVADGRVEAAWAGAGWFSGVDSAFNIFSSVPFGPDLGEYMAWMYNGGGLELAREMFHANGVHNIPCGMIPPEASGWFRKEIKTTSDLIGLRMRFFGLGARVMQKHGVSTQQLAPGDILAAMEAGELDAAEFSLPAMDKPLGFAKVAKYYYFPGWHQQATLFDLYFNKEVWDRLPKQHQAIIEIACGDAMRRMIAAGEAAQWKAMKELQEAGVQLRRWPPEILVSFEDAWIEVVKEESEKNPNFARIYSSFAQFRENYAIWRNFSALH
jgi:TRAP-type mannitol/chloroaromatic compound transport system substrate-binding protein